MREEVSREVLHRAKGASSQKLMKLKILCWNVRGANDSSKRKLIKAFVRNQKVDLLCIQETKIQLMSEGVVRSQKVDLTLYSGDEN